MTVYVKIKKLNGRNDFFDIASRLNSKGFGDRIEYHQGGWGDDSYNMIAAHLKFEDHGDALAYVLAYGGEISKVLPKMIPGVDFYPGG